jgi:hypothetical protein
MPARYVRVWLPMEAAIEYVVRVARCSEQEARDALVQAILDGEIRSRFGDNGLEDIKASLWEYARYWAPYSALGARGHFRITGDAAYLRPYFDPPPDRSRLPEHLRPVEVRREEVQRLWPEPPASQGRSGRPVGQSAPAEKDDRPTTPSGAGYLTGLPGKPTSWHLVEAECRRRFEAGERHPRTGEWARSLVEWLHTEHPSAPPVTEKTVRNKLAPLLRELGSRPIKGLA